MRPTIANRATFIGVDICARHGRSTRQNGWLDAFNEAT